MPKQNPDLRFRATELRKGLFPICLLLGLTVYGCGGDRRSQSDVPTGHAKMLEALQKVKDQDAYQTLYFGAGSIEDDLQKLEQTPEILVDARLSQLVANNRRRQWT